MKHGITYESAVEIYSLQVYF